MKKLRHGYRLMVIPADWPEGEIYPAFTCPVEWG